MSSGMQDTIIPRGCIMFDFNEFSKELTRAFQPLEMTVEVDGTTVIIIDKKNKDRELVKKIKECGGAFATISVLDNTPMVVMDMDVYKSKEGIGVLYHELGHTKDEHTINKLAKGNVMFSYRAEFFADDYAIARGHGKILARYLEKHLFKMLLRNPLSGFFSLLLHGPRLVRIYFK